MNKLNPEVITLLISLDKKTLNNNINFFFKGLDIWDITTNISLGININKVLKDLLKLDIWKTCGFFNYFYGIKLFKQPNTIKQFYYPYDLVQYSKDKINLEWLGTKAKFFFKEEYTYIFKVLKICKYINLNFKNLDKKEFINLTLTYLGLRVSYNNKKKLKKAIYILLNVSILSRDKNITLFDFASNNKEKIGEKLTRCNIQLLKLFKKDQTKYILAEKIERSLWFWEYKRTKKAFIKSLNMYQNGNSNTKIKAFLNVLKENNIIKSFKLTVSDVVIK